MTRPVPLEKKKQTDITSPLDPYFGMPDYSRVSCRIHDNDWPR